jgi:hypothetical protein
MDIIQELGGKIRDYFLFAAESGNCLTFLAPIYQIHRVHFCTLVNNAIPLPANFKA